MKKFLSIILAALMLVGCLTAFAGCGSKKADELAQVALSSAADYLKGMYKNDAETTARDYDVAGKLIIGDIEYTVTWTVDTDKVSIKESETAGFYTVDVPDETAEEIPYVLTATIADAEGRTVEVTFKHVVPKLEAVKVEADKKIVLALKDGDVTKYVSGIHYLYTSSSGSKKWELKITEDKAEALPMVMKENDDKTVSFVAEDKYLLCDATNVQFVDEASDNTKYVLETATGGTFIKCAVANYGGKPQYLEMYSGYLTCYGMNESKPELYTFIIEDAGDAAGKIDIPSDTTTPDTPETPDTPDTTPITELTAVTAPVAETAYKLFLTQVSLKKNLFAIGELDQEKFYKTTETAADAPDFYVEAVDGGFKFYTTIDGAKKYVDASIVAKEDGKTSKVLSYTDSTETVWTYKEEVNAWFTTIEGEDYVIGTYGTYATLSISAATYITAENTGKTQFPAHLVLKSDAENFTPDTPETPETPDDTETPDNPGASDIPETVTPITTIAAMTEASGEVKYLVQGIITEVYNTTYGNMYIRDAAGNTLTIYGAYDTEGNRYDAMANKPQAGDFVSIVGVVTVYKEKGQIKDGTVLEIVTPSAVTEIAGKTEASTDLHLVKGEIKSIYNDTYGNMYLKDAEGNEVCIYGTFDEAGNRFDAMTAKPAVGDTIAVIGEVSVYKEKGQIKNGVIVLWDAATPEGGESENPETPADPVVPAAGTKYDFATLADGTQYVDETRALDANVTLKTVNKGCYIKSGQIRLYDSTYEGTVTDGWAILECTKAVKSFSVNVGNKDATLNVYGSTDGTTWTLIQAVATTKTNADHTVTIPAGTAYTYIRLDAVGAQLRVSSVTIEFAA